MPPPGEPALQLPPSTVPTSDQAEARAAWEGQEDQAGAGGATRTRPGEEPQSSSGGGRGGEAPDTAGQERYRTITTAYYRGAMGFLLMYDISNQESFSAVQDWATQIKTYSWDNAQVILIGNKCDLEDERVVPTEDGKRLADDLGFEFFEASAKDNINVKQVFERLVDIICEKMNESLDANSTIVSNNKSPSLSETPPPQASSCAC
ncbi:ras-related protein Rab-3D isoform X2 [Ornithorhynchus anatinus]|uniref:ras-related protein Rab-3D isoform X2 n=1 Tax=Ornithorhynchus anatinus TaxID=9258 RepID=UPI0010A8102C|nr:ras-related protein Rab-3D isoform X2 [Ornithorhynchus anatinus]